MPDAYDANRRYFRQAYETGRHGWDQEPSPYVAKHLALVAGLTTGRRLLDLGCGEGRHSIVAAQLGFQPVGVDYEPLAIERARRHAQATGLADKIEWRVADIYALGLPRSFDVVLDYGCLHHQRKRDWPRYLAALRAVLRPGGFLVLSTFSTNFRTYGPQERQWHLAHGAYRRFFTKEDLRGLFARDLEFLALEEEREGVRGFWHGVGKRSPR